MKVWSLKLLSGAAEFKPEHNQQLKPGPHKNPHNILYPGMFPIAVVYVFYLLQWSDCAKHYHAEIS